MKKNLCIGFLVLFLIQAGYSIEPHPVAESDSFKMEICTTLGMALFIFPQGDIWLGVYLSPLFKIIAGGSFLVIEDGMSINVYSGIAGEFFKSPRVSIEPRICAGYVFIISSEPDDEDTFGGFIQLGYNYYARQLFKISPFTRFLTSFPYFALGCEFTFLFQFG